MVAENAAEDDGGPESLTVTLKEYVPGAAGVPEIAAMLPAEGVKIKPAGNPIGVPHVQVPTHPFAVSVALYGIPT